MQSCLITNRKLSLVQEWQIMVGMWSWTSNEQIIACGKKCFLINYFELTCTGQNIFQERHLNCWQYLEFNFRSPTLVTNIFLENKFWPTALQDNASQLVSICLFYSNLHLVFTNEKGKLNILIKNMTFWQVTQHRTLFYDNQLWPQLGELQIRKFKFWLQAICQATQKICFLTATHVHLPSPSYKTFTPDNRGFSYGYLLSVASWLKPKHQTTALQKSYTLSSNLYGKYVTACMHSTMM